MRYGPLAMVGALLGLLTACAAPAPAATVTVTAEAPAPTPTPVDPVDELRTAMTVDDTFLIRYSANQIDKCFVFYIADVIGVEEGSEANIAECWTKVDEFDEIVPSFRAKIEPYAFKDNGQFTDLVDNSYSSLLMWRPVPEECRNTPGAAPAECEEAMQTAVGVARMWLDTGEPEDQYAFADAWADEVGVLP
ncbi:hypothetical protein [Naasia aerilata]|uniref:Uncharacterized protein n=1 Tax=Naasia aerilata TaxID=1162966 RepID=A0ABM8GB86_9MICO|nr:hypothetical protein [Naasia aerilata]BDZ45484.1 hypothetical protein GCM10025866_13930 [Naasia aerilata]